MQPLPVLVGAVKTIAVAPEWSDPEPETGYSWFDAPLEIGGVTEQAFFLHGGCYLDRPDCHLTFELRIGKSAGRRCIPLTRFDWRSLTGGHTNPRREGVIGSGEVLPNTHLHAFGFNWSQATGRMRRGNLRMATAIGRELENFQDVRDYVGNTFKINNIRVVPAPEWVYKFDFGE